MNYLDDERALLGLLLISSPGPTTEQLSRLASHVEHLQDPILAIIDNAYIREAHERAARRRRGVNFMSCPRDTNLVIRRIRLLQVAY